jgi:hypothetical protein
VGERQQARAIHQVEPIDVVGLKFAICLDDGFADAPDCFSTLALRRASDQPERTEKKQSCMRHCPGSGGSLAALARGQRQKDPHVISGLASRIILGSGTRGRVCRVLRSRDREEV